MLPGVILPIVFNRLQPQIGFGWATRVLGFISLATMAFTALVVKSKSLPPAPRRFFDAESFKDLAFVLDLIGCFWIFLGLYVPSFFVRNPVLGSWACVLTMTYLPDRIVFDIIRLVSIVQFKCWPVH